MFLIRICAPIILVPEKSAVSAGRICDDMAANMHSMNVMGQRMAAMTNRVCITPLRHKQPDDEERVRALVAQVRAVIETYRDDKKAIADE